MILIAIGANLPGPGGESPLRTCRAAVLALSGLGFSRVKAISRWYATAPVPRSDQPDYVNGVAFLIRRKGAVITPESLLAALQAIETRFGRARGLPNAARTLDLDIVDMEGLVRPAPDPILPHPRAHLRAFVLRPLLDVAPNWVCPGLGVTGAELLARVGEAGTRVLED